MHKHLEELYSIRVRVIIKVFSLEDGKTLAIFNIPDKTFPDTRGFGASENVATQDAFSLKRAEGFFNYVAQKIEELILW